MYVNIYVLDAVYSTYRKVLNIYIHTFSTSTCNIINIIINHIQYRDTYKTIIMCACLCVYTHNHTYM